MGLVEYQDVGVGFDFFSFFSNCNSYVCDSQFSQGCQHQLFCCQCQLLTPDNSFGSVEFFMQVGFAFGCMEDFHFQYVFCFPLAHYLDKQVSASDFLNIFQCSPC